VLTAASRFVHSSQVEFHANAVALRRRGLATLTIDGPGQGALATRTVMRADYEVIVAEALDAALATGLRPRAIGLMGLSLGGFYGAVSLAREPRLAAGVTVSGPSRLDWKQLPPLLQAILTARAGSEDVAHTFTAQVDLADIAPTITQPLLVVGRRAGRHPRRRQRRAARRPRAPRRAPARPRR